MKLTDDFYLHEFTRSQVAARLGRIIEVGPEELSNILRLCTSVLQPLRTAIQRVITVNSGLRPPWLNGYIGGSTRSSHLWGGAGDIVAAGMTPLALCQRVQELDLPVDQCILEFPPHGWTHVSVAAVSKQPRRQYLTATVRRGKTVYLEGLLTAEQL